jgi:cell division protein FtsB
MNEDSENLDQQAKRIEELEKLLKTSREQNSAKPPRWWTEAAKEHIENQSQYVRELQTSVKAKEKEVRIYRSRKDVLEGRLAALREGDLIARRTALTTVVLYRLTLVHRYEEGTNTVETMAALLREADRVASLVMEKVQ